MESPSWKMEQSRSLALARVMGCVLELKKLNLAQTALAYSSIVDGHLHGNRDPWEFGTVGDFNWDGIISGDDYSAIDFNLVAQGPPIPVNAAVVASNEVSAVPEPGLPAVVWVIVAAASARRRRRGRPGVS